MLMPSLELSISHHFSIRLVEFLLGFNSRIKNKPFFLEPQIGSRESICAWKQDDEISYFGLEDTIFFDIVRKQLEKKCILSLIS